MALRYAVLYAIVLGAALLALGWTTSRYVGSTVKAGLQDDFLQARKSYDEAGIAGLGAELDAMAGKGEDRYGLLVGKDGERIAGNLLRWPKEGEFELDGQVHNAWIDDNALPMSIDDDEVYWPTIAYAFAGGERLLLGHSVEQDKSLHELVEYLTQILGAAFMLGLLMSVQIGRAILRRMDAIGRTAGGIMSGDLSQRVPTSARHDEFDALATRLNAMLDRIQQLVRGLREVTDNVAHDLRSPLTRLRNRIEVTLLEHRDEAEYRQALALAVEDAEELIRTFNALLGIANAEAGNHRSEWQAFDVMAVAADLADLYGPLAAERQQHLDFEGMPATLHGSRQLVAQAIGNVLENAIKYSPKGGHILFSVRTTGGAVVIEIRDEGAGIPAAERRHVLERFVRLEGSRHTPGNGLGLALVHAVVRVHGAELTLSDAGPGLLVTLRFSSKPAGSR